MFDYNKRGEIEVDKIRTILVTLGNPYDEAELERLIKQEDSQGEYEWLFKYCVQLRIQEEWTQFIVTQKHLHLSRSFR